jgi:hypothetical protein
LPSELENEDCKTIEELIVVMNAINEHQKKADRKTKRKELAKKYGATQRR